MNQIRRRQFARQSAPSAAVTVKAIFIRSTPWTKRSSKSSECKYRLISSEANLVLMKIGRTGRISEAQIQEGLEWVLAKAGEYQIKIVNMSAGGDYEESYLTNRLSQTVERCTPAGITVVC